LCSDFFPAIFFEIVSVIMLSNVGKPCLIMLHVFILLQDQKKIQEQLITEQETLFGSKPIKANLSSKKGNGGSRPSVGGTGSQPNRRLSLGNALMQPATPELLRTNGVTTTPSRLGASVGKDTKRERARPVAPLNYVALNKDDNAGLNSAGDIASISLDSLIVQNSKCSCH
jgi:hypothetical protein